MIKWALMCAAPVAVAGGAYLHGPIAWGTVYDKPSKDVAAQLETMALPQVMGMTLAGEGNSSRMTVPGQSVIYLFQRKGAQAAKFVVDITPTDATHTRVSTRMEMSPDADKLFGNELVSGSEEFETVGTAAMNEKIDSLLSGRPYNEDVVKKAMMSFALGHIGQIQSGVRQQLDKAVATERQMKSVEASGAAVIVPGQPMSQTTPN